jgi:uncharacterized protein
VHVTLLRASFFETSDDGLEPEPLNPDWIKEGNPVARSRYLLESPDKLLRAGIWDCTAGKFKFIYYFDEIIQVLEGEAHVDDGYTKRTLKPGTVVNFPLGMEADWHIPKYIRKTFVLRALKPSRVRLAAWKVKQRVISLLPGRAGMNKQ